MRSVNANPSLEDMLQEIADGRGADPLAPVTVVCPSHLSALQMRRRLAELTPFAAVRFETLPRLAELIAAGDLAAAGRRPLARPIGDHLAERVGALAGPPLRRSGSSPASGARYGGCSSASAGVGCTAARRCPPAAAPTSPRSPGSMACGGEAIAEFYDEDDLLAAAAAAVEAAPDRARELGRLYLVPPGPRSAAGARLVDALEAACGGRVTAADPSPAGDVHLLLAPDRSSEAREAARAVVGALEDGVAIDRIAVLHGADRAYARLLREALAAADVPLAAMPRGSRCRRRRRGAASSPSSTSRRRTSRARC